MSRQKKLLIVVALLSLVQFLVVPAFNFLDEKRETIAAKTNKQRKEKALLALKEPIEQQMAELEGSLSILRASAFKTNSLEAGTLEIQKVLEDAANKYHVKLNRINWLENEEEPDLHTIQIAIKASPADWVLLQSELEAKSWLVLEKMSFFYSRRTGDKSLISDVSGVLAYNVNFWVTTDADL